ncbi:MAG TPA: DUF4386 family protein [Spirochaetia bacterium]|nr:DUF4386 family protein [Spirochaetia bacterium]
MDTYRRAGIVTGILFIIATMAGCLSLFAQPILDAPDYLTRIATNEPKVLTGAGIGAVLILMMATLSRNFIRAGSTDSAQFQNLGALLIQGRGWVIDVAAILAWCIGAFLYYSLFFKTRLVPRWLSVWGLLGISLTIAPQEMVIAIWLIVKGFRPSTNALRQPSVT